MSKHVEHERDFKNLNQFLNWLASMFEGSDGAISMRKVIAFIITCVYAVSRVIYNHSVQQDIYLLYGLIVDVVFVLLLVGILTAQNIVGIIQNVKGNTNVEAKIEPQ